MSTESELSPVAAVVVLAAGGGTRMKSTKSKLLHEVAGKSMLSFAVSSAAALDPEHLVVVVGHLREQVEEHLEKLSASVTTAVQDEQLGTGHAVGCGLAGLGDLDGDVVVTYADVPMLTGDTLRQLVAVHRAHQNSVTVLTAEVLGKRLSPEALNTMSRVAIGTNPTPAAKVAGLCLASGPMQVK